MRSRCKGLQVGQKVRLHELEFGCEVHVLADGETGPVLTEVEPDFIVFADEDVGVATRIPTYLVKAVQNPFAVAPEVLDTDADVVPMIAPVAASATTVEPTIETSVETSVEPTVAASIASIVSPAAVTEVEPEPELIVEPKPEPISAAA